MSIGAGGTINQVILADPYSPYSWDTEKTILFNVQLLDANCFKAVLGIDPPQTPITAATYAELGLPFYALYEGASGVYGKTDLLKTVGDLDHEVGINNTLHKAESGLEFPQVIIGDDEVSDDGADNVDDVDEWDCQCCVGSEDGVEVEHIEDIDDSNSSSEQQPSEQSSESNVDIASNISVAGSFDNPISVFDDDEQYESDDSFVARADRKDMKEPAIIHFQPTSAVTLNTVDKMPTFLPIRLLSQSQTSLQLKRKADEELEGSDDEQSN